ncbi:MAG: NAD-dependent epimerase/dehydratase family protein [Phycisphaerales bacterium]|nr:NAD-dependent epimerase/dehydratase family protein [Phycisphaerales bacterium]
MIKVLILGHNGFIGKHLLNYFLQQSNLQITILSRTFNTQIPKSVHQIQGDYCQKEDLTAALKNQDIVYHLISATIPATSWLNPNDEINQNLVPFIQFLQIASEQNVKKVCFASSGGTVYGLQQNILNEDNANFPYSPYGIVKNAMEHFLYYFKKKSNLNYTIFRISNVYGEGQNVSKGLGFINTALHNIVIKKPIVIFGDGENIRDYIYVYDLVKLMFIGISDGWDHSELYNIGSTQVFSLNQIIELFRRLIHQNFELNYQDARTSDVKKIVLDNSKIIRKMDANFSFTPFETGILNTYNSIKTS